MERINNNIDDVIYLLRSPNYYKKYALNDKFIDNIGADGQVDIVDTVLKHIDDLAVKVGEETKIPLDFMFSDYFDETSNIFIHDYDYSNEEMYSYGNGLYQSLKHIGGDMIRGILNQSFAGDIGIIEYFANMNTSVVYKNNYPIKEENYVDAIMKLFAFAEQYGFYDKCMDQFYVHFDIYENSERVPDFKDFQSLKNFFNNYSTSTKIYFAQRIIHYVVVVYTRLIDFRILHYTPVLKKNSKKELCFELYHRTSTFNGVVQHRTRDLRVIPAIRQIYPWLSEYALDAILDAMNDSYGEPPQLYLHVSSDRNVFSYVYQLEAASSINMNYHQFCRHLGNSCMQYPHNDDGRWHRDFINIGEHCAFVFNSGSSQSDNTFKIWYITDKENMLDDKAKLYARSVVLHRSHFDDVDEINKFKYEPGPMYVSSPHAFAMMEAKYKEVFDENSFSQYELHRNREYDCSSEVGNFWIGGTLKAIKSNGNTLKINDILQQIQDGRETIRLFAPYIDNRLSYVALKKDYYSNEMYLEIIKASDYSKYKLDFGILGQIEPSSFTFYNGAQQYYL